MSAPLKDWKAGDGFVTSKERPLRRWPEEVDVKVLMWWKKKRIEEGDLVRVRTKEEIRATLDQENKCKDLEFMEAMWSYCGQTYRVVRKLDRIVIDENRLIMAKSRRGMFVLEGLFCEGDVGRFAQCDRNCALLWRQEWLEKVE